MPGHVIVAGHGHVCEQPAKLPGHQPSRANGLYLRPALSLLAQEQAPRPAARPRPIPPARAARPQKTKGISIFVDCWYSG